ncbi:MAG: hypothetical protein ILP02_04175, partial [Clostridia bacterium]|nr:hypothetical protein [Clostridia bacterium]
MKSKLIMITIAVITALTLMTACAEIDLGLGDDWFQPLFPNSASESASSPSADSAGAGVTSVGTSDSGQSTDGSQSASAANSASASQSASSSGGQGDAPVAFEDYDDISDRTFTSSMPAMLTGKGHYEIDTTVKKCYFDKSSLLYDKRVAMFSFALAVATDTEANLKSFFSGAGFDTDVLTVDYDKTPTADTMAYGIAKKDMNGFT